MDFDAGKMVMSGGAARIQASAHMDMLGHERMLLEVTPRALPHVFFLEQARDH
jgi:hypothetical protein